MRKEYKKVRVWKLIFLEYVFPNQSLLLFAATALCYDLLKTGFIKKNYLKLKNQYGTGLHNNNFKKGNSDLTKLLPCISQTL